MLRVPAAATALAVLTAFPASGRVPTPDHVVVLVLENHDYVQIVGSPAAPYLNGLLAEPATALFTEFSALTHPSQPNYLELFSGSNQGVTDNNVPANLPFTTPNLGGALLAAGYSFVGYSQGLPYAGYDGAAFGAYARKHNPWANWQDSPSWGVPSASNQPFTAFPADFDALPTLSFVVPDQDHDMHNGSDPARITACDSWVQANLDAYVQWAKTHRSLFIVTFDENDNRAGNRILTFFVGHHVRRGVYPRPITHYHLLRTLGDMYGLAPSGGAASVPPITDCWAVGIRTRKAADDRGGLALGANTPDPFRGSTTVPFTVPAGLAGPLDLRVVDVAGRHVATLRHGVAAAGEHVVTFDGTHLPSGVYFCTLRVGGELRSRRMHVVR